MDIQSFFTSLNTLLIKAGVFLGSISILVVLHEWGHFICARLAGVRVHEFSIGMGKRLFGKKWGQTEYQFRLIPLGGYIRMAGEDALRDPGHQIQPDEFYGVSVYRRLLIVMAGPVMNLFLAIAAIWLVFSLMEISVWKPIAGYLPPESPGYTAGLRPGDHILQVNGVAVESLDEVREVVAREKSGEPLVLEVQRDDETFSLSVVPEIKVDRDLLNDPITYGSIGLHEYRDSVISKVFPDKPAANAGLQDGDRVVAIDGKPVSFWDEMQEMIFERAGEETTLEWIRDGQTMQGVVVPEATEITEPSGRKRTVGLIGMQKTGANAEHYFMKDYGPWEALKLSVKRIWTLTALTYRSIPKLITGKLGADNMAGPVRLAVMINDSAESGFYSWLSFLGIISLMLAIFNLLPIPMLDGGHAAFFSVEMLIGWGEKLVGRELVQKPLNFRFIDILNQIGLTLLIFLFLFVTFQDVRYLFTAGS